MNKLSRKRAIAEGLGLLALLLLLIYIFAAAYDSVIADAAPRADAASATPTPHPLPPTRVSPDPFPITNTMTDTIASVLAAYQQRGISAAAEPAAVFSEGGLIYIPQIENNAPTPTPIENPTPTPSPTPRPGPAPKPADIAVAIWPAPSIRVARGGALAYEIRVKNYGDGGAESIRVTLPYDKRQIIVTGSALNGPEDWVSELKDDHVTVTFGPLKADKSRTATLFFQVNSALADNTVLSERAYYDWDDEDGDGAGSSNWAPLLVGGGNDSAPWVWTRVDPTAGAAGTTHHFFSDRFIPGEGIITWLNTPDGVKPLDLRGQADQMGRVWIDFKSDGRRPGTYSLVLYGARSNLTGVATFYVQ